MFPTVLSCHLEEARKHIGRLASDDEEAGVQFPQAGIQILQALQQEPDRIERKIQSNRRIANR